VTLVLAVYATGLAVVTKCLRIFTLTLNTNKSFQLSKKNKLISTSSLLIQYRAKHAGN